MNGYFFDMDGTLYNTSFHEVSAKTFDVLNALQKEGHFVGLSTSRCQQELKNLPSCMRNFNFNCVISDGGSLILNEKNEILDCHVLSENVMERILDFSQKYNVMFRYSTKDGNFFGVKNEMYLRAHEIYFHLYLNTPVYKMYEKDRVLNVILFCEGSVKEKAKSEFKDLSLVEYPNCIEIRCQHVDKASGIRFIKEKNAFDRMYCFGDGPNDVKMLRLADVGVAMGNACPVLKDVADIVIGRVDEDGIYKFLKNKIGGK